MKHLKLFEGFLNESQVGFEVVWKDEDKESHAVVLADIKDAEDKFKQLQKDDVITVQINKLTKRSTSFSEEEQDRWVNKDPKFRSYLNSRMSTEDVKKHMAFLKLRNQARENFFRKNK